MPTRKSYSTRLATVRSRQGLTNLLAGLVGSGLVLSACGGSASDEPEHRKQTNDKGSFVEAYFGLGNSSAKIIEFDVSGQWRGALFCSSGVFPLQYDVTQTDSSLDGTASISPAVGRPRQTSPFHEDHIDRKGSGEIQSTTGLSVWSTNVAEAEGSSSSRDLVIRMTQSPNDMDMAVVAAFEMAGGRIRRDCTGAAGRNARSEQINSFLATSLALHEDRRPVVQTTCQPKYRQWIEAGLAGEDAFADPLFKAAFGASFRDLGSEARLKASAEIKGSCVGGLEQRDRIKAVRQAASLRSSKSYDAAHQTYWREQILPTWRDWVLSTLETDSPWDYGTLVKVRSAPHIFGWRDDPQFKAFDATLAAAVDAGSDANKNIAFARRIEAAHDDFQRLLELRRQAISRGDIDLTMVSAGLAFYIEDAATHFAAEASTPEAAAFMVSWTLDEQAERSCGDLPAKVCSAVSSAFDKKTAALAKEFVKTERDAFTAIAKKASGLDGLASLVEYDNALARQYSSLLSHQTFEPFANERAKARSKLQKKHSRNIRREIEQASTAPEIGALTAKWFVADDLDQSSNRNVKKSIEASLADTTPFQDMVGADYFNAIYNRDFGALRSLDHDYTARIKPLIAFSAQQAVTMGPLIDAFTGREQGTTAADIYHGLQNLSAIHAVIGTYLVNYETTYGECLAANAPTIEISQRTDLVTTNGTGQEIRRVEGWTTRDYYRVNPEFRDQFDTLFNTATGSAQAELFDLFLNDAQITRLNRGVTELMATHKCDSAEIKQFEKGLLAYDAQLTQR